jgi:hypothetical protein
MKLKKQPSNYDFKPAIVRCKEELAYHGITFDIKEIRGPVRSDHLSCIRALICVILRLDGFTLAEIGYAVNRDHAMALHLIKNYKGQSQYSRLFAETKRSILKERKERTAKAKIRFYEHQIALLQDKIKALLKNT